MWRRKSLFKKERRRVISHFTFEPLHSFDLGILKLFKECTMTFIVSNMKITDKSRLHGSTSAVKSMRTGLLKASNSMMTAMEETYLAKTFITTSGERGQTSSETDGSCLMDSKGC